MPSNFTYQSYIDGVLSGKIVTGELIHLAVQRHVNDLKRQRTDSFPYYFDEVEGKRWIKFSSLCRQFEGRFAGQPLILEPWQQFYFAVQFGWRRYNGTRRFRNSYLEIGRKNGKTTMCAVKALGHPIIDKEAAAQVYFVATKEDQARIGFDAAKEIIKITPDMGEMFKIFQKSITKGNSYIRFLGSDSKKQDGFNPSYGVIDEYHAHPTSGMLNVIRTGMGMRDNPMIDIITTAGFNRQVPCYSETRTSCVKILNGIVADESQLAIIYTIDPTDDWEDNTQWVKSNPNAHLQDTGYLDRMHLLAQNEGGSMEVEFKTKNLNIWTDSAATWIPDDTWMKCTGDIDPDSLAGMDCHAALDLSSNRDLTVLSLLFPLPDGKHAVLCYYFVPELSAKDRMSKDGVNYGRWINEGFIEETPGNVTDYGYIRRKINELSEVYHIKRIAYDRWNSSQLIIDLTGDGFDCVPFGQGYGSMSAPCKELEKMVHAGQIMHGGNPVLRWNNSNVALATDPAGNIKINKAKSSEKVDGMVALVMALGNYMTSEKEEVFNGEIMML
jgi:phage terminase large subunit-like protein